MPVSVTMPRLGESVTEGTVTRWLKQEGDEVAADEPLLEVSTDKVDTEVPSPASGILTSIKVGEDETVEIGVELAVISDASEVGSSGPAESGTDSSAEQDTSAESSQAESSQAETSQAETSQAESSQAESSPAESRSDSQDESSQGESQPEAAQADSSQDGAAQAAGRTTPADEQSTDEMAPEEPVSEAAPEAGSAGGQSPAATSAPAPAAAPPPAAAPAPSAASASAAPQTAPASDYSGREVGTAPAAPAAAEDDEVAGTYVTPLVRKLASEHGIDLNSITGTGVGGRIRKSDVLAAAQAAAEQRAEAEAAKAAQSAPPPAATPAPAPAASPAHAQPSAPAADASGLRGQTVKLSRLRQVIAARMVESLQTSAQLTTVVEVDITGIARLREATKQEFEKREGVKLSFLPFFAVAAVEALKAHPNVNCSVDTEAGTVTYHDAEHLGIAVDTERGLLVPVIHNAGDFNLAGIARKIADLAERTRTNKVSPDELGGGTFTLTNTGSRGALFDTPIINQPQVAILGTGAVVKRPVVLSDEKLGEIIAIRSMVYLALSYDHRIVDGADAARFLTTMKTRLEAGAFERALGLG